jgi:PAS domain-containing protein
MELAKLRSEVSLALQQGIVHVREAWNALRRAQPTVADKLRLLQDAFGLGRVRESFLHPTIATSSKIWKHICIAWGKLANVGRQAQETLIRLQTKFSEKSQRVRGTPFAWARDLRNSIANSRDSILVTNDKIMKQLSIASAQLTIPSRQTLNTLIGLGRAVADQPRKAQEARRSKESDLRRLLANSSEAIIVTNTGRRVLAANSRTSELFGVSEANIREFAIDAFLKEGEVRCFDARGSPLIGRLERQGECKIMRPDGGVRIAEYIFVANFLPFRHLCKFRNDRECARKGVCRLRNNKLEPKK